MRLRTPSEWVVFDVLMHRDLLADTGPAQGIVYSDLYGERFASTYQESYRMPINVDIETLPSPDMLQPPEKWEDGMFEEMIDLIAARTGWALDEFRCQRLALPYPPLPASLVYEIEIG